MRKRWLILIIIVVVVGGLTTWSAIRPDARLDVIRPQRGLIRAYVEERAITELPHDYLISMPIAGWLEPIELREGDRVEVQRQDNILRFQRRDAAHSPGPLTDLARIVSSSHPVGTVDVESYMDRHGYEQIYGCSDS